jgi:acylphosphatase
VQGVWYRATTRREAERLALDGWANNLADGRVEIVAAGDPQAVAELCGWLWTGPPAARVESVSVQEYLEPVSCGFTIK